MLQWELITATARSRRASSKLVGTLKIHRVFCNAFHCTHLILLGVFVQAFTMFPMLLTVHVLKSPAFFGFVFVSMLRNTMFFSVSLASMLEVRCGFPCLVHA